LEQPCFSGFGQEGFASAPVGLRLQRAAGLVVLANPAHRRDTVAETDGDLGRAFALAVELKDPLADSNRDGFHTRSLSPFAAMSLHYLWKRSSDGMIHLTCPKRSQFCGIITDFQANGQRKVASLDCLGVVASAALLGLILEIARILLAN
jgi:hypothetical protein